MYLCCIYSSIIQTRFYYGSNTMNPNQTAPFLLLRSYKVDHIEFHIVFPQIDTKKSLKLLQFYSLITTHNQAKKKYVCLLFDENLKQGR